MCTMHTWNMCVGVCILMYIGEVRHELRLMASGWVPG